MGPGSSGGDVPNFQVLPDTQSGSDTSGSGAPVQAEWGQPARHWMKPIGDRLSVKVHCRLWFRQPQHRADTEGRKVEGRVQACRNRRGGWSGNL